PLPESLGLTAGFGRSSLFAPSSALLGAVLTGRVGMSVFRLVTLSAASSSSLSALATCLLLGLPSKPAILGQYTAAPTPAAPSTNRTSNGPAHEPRERRRRGYAGDGLTSMSVKGEPVALAGCVAGALN